LDKQVSQDNLRVVSRRPDSLASRNLVSLNRANQVRANLNRGRVNLANLAHPNHNWPARQNSSAKPQPRCDAQPIPKVNRLAREIPISSQANRVNQANRTVQPRQVNQVSLASPVEQSLAEVAGRKPSQT
jgi:hypothetical protein